VRPVLVTLFGHYPLHAYATMLSVAFVVCTLLAVRAGDRRGLWIPPETGIIAFLGALIGAKIFYILQYNPYAALYGDVWHRHVWRAVFFWTPGLVYYGGLLGGMAAAAAFCRWRRLPLLGTADLVVPWLALGQALTRVGCYLNGCCHGAPSGAPWAVQFPKGSYAHLRQMHDGLLPGDAPLPLPVHPTQLIMVAGLVAIMAILLAALRRQRFNGEVALYYGLLYGILRFVVEGLRGESAHSVLGMTVSQVASLGLATLAAAMLAVAGRRGWYRLPVMTFPKPARVEPRMDTNEH
jgi:phosphatidylglycerol---prolipoprotein diacylglyceryl transferase